MKFLLMFLFINCSAHHFKNKEKVAYFKDQTSYITNLNYIKSCQKKECNLYSLISSIDRLGKIYLDQLLYAKELIVDFEKIRLDFIYNDAIDDEIIDWISCAKDIEYIRNNQVDIKNSKMLLKYGNDFYQRAMKKKKFPMDRTANELLQIAQDYYLSYLYLIDGKKEVDQVMIKLGIIQSRLWYLNLTDSKNFYFKEVIRRYPRTYSSQVAFKLLSDNIHASYTGSSGDFTPRSQLELLKFFKNMAMIREQLPTPILNHGPLY